MPQQPNQWLHKWAQAGSFTIDLLETRSDARVPFHLHDEVTINVPLRGSYVENSEKHGAVGKPGVVIIERPGVAHENIYDKGGAAILRVLLSPEFERFFDLEAQALTGNTRCHAIACSVARNIESADPLMVECAALEIMGLVSNGTEWSSRSHPGFLRDVVAELRARRMPTRDVGAIAKQARVSPTRLVRAFRRSYGISLARFIRVLQAQHALSLLSDPAIPISSIAAEAGFSDQSHMTRTFVQTYGLTPARLRKDSPASVATLAG